MKLFKTTLLTLLAIPMVSNAQIVSSKDITYEIGTPYQVVDAASKRYFHNNGEILAVKFQRKEIVIQKMDAESLKFKSIREYSDMPNGWTYEGLLEFNEKYYLFYSLWDKPNETEQLFYREINFSKGTFEGKGERIIKVKGKVTGASIGYYGWWSLGTVDKFSYNISADGSKIMFKYRKKPEIKNDDKSYDIIGFNVFNENLEKVWAEEIKMPYTEKKMNNIDYSVDSYGNAYTLATVYKDNTTKRMTKDGNINYDMELLKIDAESQELSHTKIKLNDNFINRIWLYETSKGKMVCAGFYNDGRDSDDAEGIFVAKVDEGGSLGDVISHEIPLEVLNMYKSERAQNKAKKREEKGKRNEFQELELRKLLTQEDGSIVLVGEQYYIVEHTSYNSQTGRSTTYYTYHYNDILITKINPDGSLAWMKKLPKRQTGRAGRGGMGFQYTFTNDSHYLMFLDNIKNLDLPKNKYPYGHSDGQAGYLTAYKVDDKSGATERISILNTVEVPEIKGNKVYQFTVDRIVNTSENEFVVEFYKKKKEDILIKFKIN